MVSCAIKFMCPDLDLEETWVEEKNYWILVEKYEWLRGSSFKKKSVPGGIYGGHIEGIPLFHQYQSHVMR